MVERAANDGRIIEAETEVEFVSVRGDVRDNGALIEGNESAKQLEQTSNLDAFIELN